MAELRLVNGVRRGKTFDIILDGQALLAYEGETVAAVILASGRRLLRLTRKRGEPRSVFCNIGVCYECRMVIDGSPNVRACQTRASPGMVVNTQHGLGEDDIA
ncbi:MAG: (2Fe-2S)-binding protein [Betaproteobacteria bacterium]|nr:MAG: (2Fe-2S)-binding protein [Betaproteobacteria bacterium]